MDDLSAVKLASINLETLSAWITAFLVAGTSLYFMSTQDHISDAQTAAAGLSMAAFMGLWQLSVTDWVHRKSERLWDAVLVLQLGIILLIYWLVPFTYVAIFTTLWSALMPYRFSMRTCLLLSPLWSMPLWIIFSFHWQESYAWLSALLFWAFNVFALVMVNATRMAKNAQEEAQRLNQELLATQHLLAHASKEAERTRIARNIHDVLGHHLTALTIHLQVAVRTSDEQQRANLEQCHSLAKLLLSDVREAVSDMRENASFDIQDSLRALIDNTPQLTIELDYSPDVRIADVSEAEAVLRCVQEGITNCLRHSSARHLWITMNQDGKQTRLALQDDGGTTKSVVMGNGLTGMKERFRALGGDIRWLQNDRGFRVEGFFSGEHG
ncbi:histidine kinase [Aestuariibacter halophilus]|uniref:Histidine kinase n=1 Tax=Fluctibacter halophilus TaxID=226011 RepID=A0ABS8GBU1_9ALTE|nr:histidine kinase [Aestuariibacter halophilus]MCC2618044.1 histidine kinase [Aestuariibacter halophilus]